ncbi:MAG: methionine adenosyltransferase [Christensenellales bacterium]|jgi:S-adenosylmethionine synthetase
MPRKFFTSESVTEGHPDKLCDQISDGVLDAMLAQDPKSRVACEVAVTTGLCLVMGEVTTSCYVDISQIARDVILNAGFDNAAYGFDGNSCSVLVALHGQSPDIAQGVDASLEARQGIEDRFTTGAGDQGMMFGFACRETDELMPAPISYAHNLTRALSAARKSGVVPYLRPDGKAQVTLEYEDGRPIRVDTVVLSTQHAPEVEQEQIQKDMIDKIILPSLPKKLVDEQTKFLINPTGRFVVGGPHGDSGLTGRKIIADTYGGYARHGGGAFSGKDPTKVDRSAAYAARHVAKNIVASGLAESCEIQVAYAIGVARPVSIMVDTFGTGAMPDDKIAKLILEKVDLRPEAIIERLGLRAPIYAQTAAYGHFGRPDLDLPWERLDLPL